jgi:hypothetical protein
MSEQTAVETLRAAAELLRASVGPSTWAALADWLEAVVAEMTGLEGTEYAYGEYTSWEAALTTARAILKEGF